MYDENCCGRRHQTLLPTLFITFVSTSPCVPTFLSVLIKFHARFSSSWSRFRAEIIFTTLTSLVQTHEFFKHAALSKHDNWWEKVEAFTYSRHKLSCVCHRLCWIDSALEAEEAPQQVMKLMEVCFWVVFTLFKRVVLLLFVSIFSSQWFDRFIYLAYVF